MVETAPFHLQEAVQLSRYSTFGIGGPAQYFTEIRSIESMASALQYCRKHHIFPLVLGKGSNCLFDDRGFKGMVLLNRIDYLESDQEGRFQVGAGYSFARLGGVTARRGWSGLEFASGIPGSVGGAVYMNAGAGCAETCDVLTAVSYVDLMGNIHHFKRNELEFEYRWSPFQQKLGAIVEASFQLHSSEQAKEKQTDLLHYRQSTQPYGQKSAGCVFRNPDQKAAGQLIEELKLKGMAVGDAEVSTIHGNFIVNRGSATAAEVKQLITLIQQEVKQKAGIRLYPEVRCVPYEPQELLNGG